MFFSQIKKKSLKIWRKYAHFKWLWRVVAYIRQTDIMPKSLFSSRRHTKNKTKTTDVSKGDWYICTKLEIDFFDLLHYFLYITYIRKSKNSTGYFSQYNLEKCEGLCPKPISQMSIWGINYSSWELLFALAFFNLFNIHNFHLRAFVLIINLHQNVINIANTNI